MRVFDVFPFYNELDLLELRLHILNPYVDYFIIGQANRTFSGLEKPFYFDVQDPRFSKFADKIIEHRLTKDIDGDPFQRDSFQKASIRGVLDSICDPEDLIIFSDVDEIPNPKVLDDAFSVAQNGLVAHLAQHLHYYYLDLREISGTLLSYTGEFPGVQDRKWLGTKIIRFGTLGDRNLPDLRSAESISWGQRISNGGWHFSYVGGLDGTDALERAREKIRDFAHQELNTMRNRLFLRRRISKGLDPFGRSSARFSKISLDETFPEYLTTNIASYSHLLAP
jgi:beta-1,4-mannosyl-glycoprotein beta-1,4-N-acetylglucosaminyltransferase